MNPNKLTTKAQEALQSMLSLAREKGQQSLEADHLLRVLLDQSESVVPATLQKIGVSIPNLIRETDQSLSIFLK